MIQTGLAAPSKNANVRTAPLLELFGSNNLQMQHPKSRLNQHCKTRDIDQGNNQDIETSILEALPSDCLKLYKDSESPPQIPTLTIKNATTAFVDGYLIRVVHDRHECANCENVMTMPASNLPLCHI